LSDLEGKINTAKTEYEDLGGTYDWSIILGGTT
jgi:hypothetical protein